MIDRYLEAYLYIGTRFCRPKQIADVLSAGACRLQGLGGLR